MKKQLINQILNIFWTGLCIGPVVWYWYSQGLDFWWYIILFIAFIVAFLPRKIIESLNIFNNRRQYEKWGVKLIQQFVQGGRWVSRLDKRDRAIKDVRQATHYLTTIAMYERFHWMCFVFFLLSSIHASIHGVIHWGFLIFLANIPYNVASLLLQQYNRLRITAFVSNFRLKEKNCGTSQKMDK